MMMVMIMMKISVSTPLTILCLSPTPGHNSPPISGEGGVGGGDPGDLVPNLVDNAHFSNNVYVYKSISIANKMIFI